MRLVVLTLAVIFISACQDQPPASDASRVNIANGQLMGFEHKDNTYAWFGIPYAKPPVNELRWRAPQAADAWSGVLDALSYGSACVQLPNPTTGSNAPESELIVGVEDCLTLNVVAPRSALDSNETLKKAMPVMVWIHGGGNTVGSPQVYDGAKLASTQEVIFVSMNYRLGLLGWFRHASLRENSQTLNGIEKQLDDSGNYGSLDIIAALEWVKQNIAEFGGDPERVTVFGESAGGRNTWSLIQSPLAKGLFHGAIVQSGSLRTMDAEKSELIDPNAMDYPRYVNNSNELVEKWLALDSSTNTQSEKTESTASILRQLSPDQLYASLVQTSHSMYQQPRLFLDGKVFVKPALELFTDPANYNAVPIITGSNRDEDKLFMQLDDYWVDSKFGFLPVVKDTERYNRAAAYGADTWRVLSVDTPSEVIALNGGAPIYNYRFDFDDLITWPADLATLVGAGHAIEIPFVFGNEGESIWRWIFNKPALRADLSETMMSYWGEFAYNGSPGRGRNQAAPLWSAWQPEGEHIMLFDVANDGANGKESDDPLVGKDGGVRMADQRITLADIKSRLKHDDAFTAEEKCSVYHDQFLNGYQASVGYSEAEVEHLVSGGCSQFDQ